MALLSPPSVSRNGDQPPDDLDRVLRAFFKAQMPDPWPSREAPAPRRTLPFPAARPATRWPLMRSRLALAASVALLALGLLLIAGAFQNRSPQSAKPLNVNGGTASSQNDPIHGMLHEERPLDAPADGSSPPKLRIDESLIQGPDGTTIKVNVIDWPTPPK